jgi:hypothetical protein
MLLLDKNVEEKKNKKAAGRLARRMTFDALKMLLMEEFEGDGSKTFKAYDLSKYVKGLDIHVIGLSLSYLYGIVVDTGDFDKSARYYKFTPEAARYIKENPDITYNKALRKFNYKK